MCCKSQLDLWLSVSDRQGKIHLKFRSVAKRVGKRFAVAGVAGVI